MEYSIESIRKSYGKLSVIDGISAVFRPESVNVILGPSGCGKTSLLNIIAGLDADYTGSVRGFDKAKAAFVFQEDRLAPWMTALDNVAFVLRPLMNTAAAKSRAEAALASVGLIGFGHTLPGALSGGMKRRVALARAFAYAQAQTRCVLFLDEAFSSLDLKTRIAVMDVFLALRAADKRTAIVVTHDVREAVYLADTIVCLSDQPASIVSIMDVPLSREERGYTHETAARLSSHLYETLLS